MTTVVLIPKAVLDLQACLGQGKDLRKTMFSVLIPFFLLLYYTSSCLSQTPKADSANELSRSTDALFSKWNSKQSPGVSVAVLNKGRVIYKKAFGMANLEYGVPISDSSIFQVASLSKQFTAFSIALLAGQGELSVNDDVHKYIPELPDYGREITLLNLITHTSGLKDQWDLLFLAGWKADDVITNDDVLGLILKQKELNFFPGERFQYCNSGYTLLALVVERITGQKFSTWTRQNIFTPLGMNNSFFVDNYEAIIPNEVCSYKAAERGFHKSLINSTTVGANGLHTTTNDLLKWVKNYGDMVVGNARVINIVNSIPNLPDSTGDRANNGSLKLNYGYGQGIRQYRGQLLIGHDGADAGYRTYIGRFPNEDFAVILLGNFEAFEPEKTALKIADIYLSDKLQRESEDDKVAGKKILIPETLEKAISGEYKIDRGRTLRILVVDRNIIGEIKKEKRRFDLIPLSDTEYIAQSEDINIKFLRNKVNSEKSIEFSEKGKSVTAVKLENPDLSYLTEFTGNFFCEALNSHYSIAFKDSHLVALLPRNNAVIITQIEGDSFAGSYWWIRDIRFNRNASNEISGFEINNGRAKKIQFQRINAR